jgi:hypothetical protein
MGTVSQLEVKPAERYDAGRPQRARALCADILAPPASKMQPWNQSWKTFLAGSSAIGKAC